MSHNNFNDMDFTDLMIALITGIRGVILNFIKRDNAAYSISKKITMFIMDITVNIKIKMLIYILVVANKIKKVTYV